MRQPIAARRAHLLRRRMPIRSRSFEILDEAQRALQSDPERAIAHAQRHRLRFPDGLYAQEREVIAIDALLQLQRPAAAQRRARAFLKLFPGSSHRTRVTAQLERAGSARR